MPIDPTTGQAMTPTAFAEKYGRAVVDGSTPAPLVVLIYRLTLPSGQCLDLTQAQAERLRDELSATVEGLT